MRQFLGSLVLAALLPGVLGTLGLLTWQYHQGRAQLERSTLQSTRALAKAVDSRLLRLQSVGQVLAGADELGAGDLAGFHAMAGRTIAAIEGGMNVILFDRTGQQLLNTGAPYGAPLPRSINFVQVREVFETGVARFSDLLFAPVAQCWGITINLPVVRAGQVRYVLALGIAARNFDTLLSAEAVPGDRVIAILDRVGRVVDRTRAPEQFVGKLAMPDVRAAFLGRPEGWIEGRTLDGVPAFSFFSRAPVSGWTVAIGVSSTTVLQGYAHPVTLFGLGVAVLLALGLLLAWIMGGRIAASVKALILPAFALGEGERATFGVIHVREAARVAEAIRRAQDLLGERQAALAQRDAKLAEAHRLARFGTWHWNLRSDRLETSASVGEMLGRPLARFADLRGTCLTASVWATVRTHCEETWRTGSGFDLEVPARHADGHLLWVRLRCEGVKREQGAAVALFGAVQEITTIKEIELALRASERAARRAARQAEARRRRLDAVLAAAPVGLVVAAAPTGAMLEVNAAHRFLWGAAAPLADSVAGYGDYRGWWADGPRQGQPVTAGEWPMARALRGTVAGRDLIEIESFDQPPVRRLTLTSSAPVRDAAGRLIGAVTAQMDVTERVRAERALRLADRRKDEFLAMLAHELRNPLAPISAAADILALGPVTEDRLARTSAIISRQVRHLTTIVEDLLDVSRVMRGMVTLERERLELGEVLNTAVDAARASFAERQQSLRLRQRDAALWVEGDRKRLVQVVANLLSNAAKFTPAGGEIRVTLEASGEDRAAVLRVADNGIGMSVELQQSVFELFTQGERSLDRAQGGLGIGLALVKSLVEMHGGSVAAHSRGLGLGSTFIVRLPLAQPSAPEPAA